MRAAVPLAAPVFAFGVSFGALAESAGFNPFLAVAMSATTFAGSAQFAAASILTAGGGAAAALIAGFLLNARYVPIGISLAPAIAGPVWKRFLYAQLAVDESWAVSHIGDGRYDKDLLFGAGLTLYLSGLVALALVPLAPAGVPILAAVIPPLLIARLTWRRA